MVTCDNQNAQLGGFHLGARDDESRRPRAPSVSSLSVYKQKIDALFDDNRSVASLPQYEASLAVGLQRRDSKASSAREAKVIYEDDDGYCKNNADKINNTVQDRIERMFADMAGESRQSAENIGIHVFSVHYLGSTPLQNKVTSLSGLQTPLRDLYFAYRRNYYNKSTLTGRLEISKSGLKVRYTGDKGDLEQLNPFPTIAVWSAVKFVVQPSENKSNELGYAFLPLITDPDNIDRQALFKTLEPPDKKYILSHNENSHSPLFAVVMRKIGVAKQLECHGFVCQTTEDAIVIAATLYKSLMSHMSRQGHNDKKKLRNRNGISCMSVGSSISPSDIIMPMRPPRKKRSTSSSGDSDRADGFSASEYFSDKPKLERTRKISSDNLPRPPSPPSIPPTENKRITVEQVKAKLDSIKHNDNSGSDTHDSRKSSIKACPNPIISKLQNSEHPHSGSESSVRSKVSEKIELFRELERRKSIQRPPTLPPPIPIKPTEAPPDPPKEPLRRSQSGRKSINESGDILTKVAIPRSGSFLNAGGLTRYKSIGHRNNGKKSGGSPLGFNELFNEFKVQENLHSMDEILSAIIDAEGMSFNDLKPIYKEFLLKLSVTLTKDEIFQHSKAIMKKQKKKILRRNSTHQNNRKKIFKGANGLRMVFRLPFGKEVRKKESKNILSTLDFQTNNNNTKEPISESSVSTSSYDVRQFRAKEPVVPPSKRQASRQRNSKRSDKSVHGKSLRPGERTSTSEDSDFLTLSNRLGCQNRNSSSGYVSCSECESESCVDRCYCSLKDDCKSKCYCSAVEVKKESTKRLLTKSKSCKDCSKEYYDGDFSYCSCDSESCADSNKCYCAGPRRGTMQSSQSLEYLRSSSQRASSDRMKRYDEYDGRSSRTRLTSASNRRREDRGRRARSSDSLALDYELLLQNKARDTRSRNMQRLTVRSTGAGSHDALSVKKSAEMAALFADVRLSQRTDVRSLCAGHKSRILPPPPLPPGPPRAVPPLARMFDHRPLSRNASLEDTLGYLP